MSSGAKILHNAFADTYKWVGELKDALLDAKYQILELERVAREHEANAKLGELVRGMQNDTGLGWEDGLYYVLRCHYPSVGQLVWYRQESGVYSENPVDVLRTIQEQKDD